MRLQGKVAIVTGGAAGIGKAAALAMASEGADIVIADIDLPSGQKAADEVKATGHRAIAVKVDVSSSTQVNQMVKDTLKAFGKIDVLVNSAGIDNITPFEDVTEATWDRVVGIDLKGIFLCSQAVGREMIKQKRGKIINIVSTAGHRAVPGHTPYCASKGGALQLTRIAAIEWAKHGIRVNSISPGVTQTALVDQLVKTSPDFLKGREKMIPLGKINQPKDIVDTILFLASSESDMITGQDIVVDGGSVALHPSYVQTLWP